MPNTLSPSNITHAYLERVVRMAKLRTEGSLIATEALARALNERGITANAQHRLSRFQALENIEDKKRGTSTQSMKYCKETTASALSFNGNLFSLSFAMKPCSWEAILLKQHQLCMAPGNIEKNVEFQTCFFSTINSPRTDLILKSSDALIEEVKNNVLNSIDLIHEMEKTGPLPKLAASQKNPPVPLGKPEPIECFEGELAEDLIESFEHASNFGMESIEQLLQHAKDMAEIVIFSDKNPPVLMHKTERSYRGDICVEGHQIYILPSDSKKAVRLRKHLDRECLKIIQTSENNTLVANEKTSNWEKDVDTVLHSYSNPVISITNVNQQKVLASYQNLMLMERSQRLQSENSEQKNTKKALRL